MNKGLIKRLSIASVLLTAVMVTFFWRSEKVIEKEKQFILDKQAISTQIGNEIRSNRFPGSINVNIGGVPRQAHVEYSIEPRTQLLAEKLLAHYQPDYAAFVAMDARTGRILALTSLNTTHKDYGNLALRSLFPAASIFKVVTAAAALDQERISPDTIIPFNGASHTLYRRNVEETKFNRWTRYVTLREAFAKSINTVFGKVGIFHVGAANLRNYAERFQFNRAIAADFPVDSGSVVIDDNDRWGLAEAASGFTSESKMSPLQGALIAAAVANDGVMMEPYLVKSVQSESPDHQLLYAPRFEKTSVTMAPEAARNLRILMRETIIRGTSRKTFRQVFGRHPVEDVEMGGKTGSLTGTDPKGKVDWFIGYARAGEDRIAVAALTIHEKYWKVKSSYLAGAVLEDFLKSRTEDRHLASDTDKSSRRGLASPNNSKRRKSHI